MATIYVNDVMLMFLKSDDGAQQQESGFLSALARRTRRTEWKWPASMVGYRFDSPYNNDCDHPPLERADGVAFIEPVQGEMLSG